MDDTEYWNNEFEKTKRFLELCSPEVHNYVTRKVGLYIKAHPTSPLTKERQNRWDRYIASNPILQRVIYYIYSPADAIELRYDKMRSATNLGDDGCYIYFALRDPDFPNDALLRDFLEKMAFDMDRVSAADNWKREGAKESIEELRKRAFQRETFEDKTGRQITKIIIDQSPDYKDKIIAKRHPDGTITEKYNTYILSKDEPDTSGSGFMDEHLIRWMQLSEDDEELRETAYSKVVCPKCDYKKVLSSYGTFQCLGCGHRFTDEEVKGKEDYVYVHKISAKIKKIPFGLGWKYRPLREKIHRKHHFEREAYWLRKDKGPLRDKIDRHWELEQIYREEILNWDGKTPPPVWFKNKLKWRFLNDEELYRKRFVEVKHKLIKCKQCGISLRLSKEFKGECPSCYNLIDPQDLEKAKKVGADFLKADLDSSGGSLDEQEWKDNPRITKKDNPRGKEPDPDFGAEILRLVDRFDDPIDKELFLDLYNSCCSDGKPTSHVEMSRLLKERGISEMTPQGIGKRRKKLRATLQEYFSK